MQIKEDAEPPPTAGAGEPVFVPVAIGELVDKITILEIKSERITEPAKLFNIRRELEQLLAVWNRRAALSPVLTALIKELKKTNERLWEVEDSIRECERQGEFGARFVELARAVYRTNDRRSALKRKINELSGSAIIEEKSYHEYR